MKQTLAISDVRARAEARSIAHGPSAEVARGWAPSDDALRHPGFYRVFGRCLAALPPQAARAFVLREIEGRSVGEIARMLGLAEVECLALLHTARTGLCEALERHGLTGTPE